MTGQSLGSWSPSYERKAVILLALGFGLVGVDRTIIAPLFPVIAEDLGLSYGALGGIAGILAIFWGIFAMIMGGLSDKVGRRVILIPSMIAFSLLAGLTGLATGLGFLLVIRAAMGVFEGAFTPTSIAATAEASKPSRRGLNLGIQQSTFTLMGLGLGPIIATQLLFVVPSWRWVFVIVALPGLVVAYYLHKVLREPAHTDRSLGDAGSVERRRWREIFGYRNVYLGTFALFGAFSCIFVISALLPSYLTDYLRLSVPQMGFVMAAVGFGGFVGVLLVLGVSDRVGRKPVITFALAVAAVTLVAFAGTGANPVLLFVLLFVVAMFASGGLITVSALIVPESVPPSLIASAAGIPIGLGEISGGGVSPIVAGFVAQSFGIQYTLYVALAGLALAFVISFFLKETAPIKGVPVAA